MTKDEKISNFERVLSWLPEAFKSWATSNPFLSSTLNEVLNERDTRLSGTPCTSRLKTAVTALLQKLQDRRDKSAALILAASREAEETAFTLASRMSEGTGLRIAATTGVRDGAGLAAIFATAPDLVVTNPKVLKKVFDKGFVAPEAFRTILVDGAEWHDVMGDTDLIASLVERFTAALQLIVTGPVVVETTEDPYNAMLHAPAYCRAPDEAAREAAPKERVVLVPEEKMSETLAREAEKTPVLFLVSTPTESTRVTGLLKEAGIAAKRATATQSASARETLVLKFIAGRVEHLVMPHSVIGELEHNRASRVILTDLSGGPEPYLEHLALTADGTGELVTIVTPETLPLFEKLLIAAEKRLTLENPYNLPEPRTVIGQLLRREKLTIRTKYGRTAESTEGDRGEQDDRGEGRSRWERRKSKNGQRKDRKDGFRCDRKDFRKDEQGKTSARSLARPPSPTGTKPSPSRPQPPKPMPLCSLRPLPPRAPPPSRLRPASRASPSRSAASARTVPSSSVRKTPPKLPPHPSRRRPSPPPKPEPRTSPARTISRTSAASRASSRTVRAKPPERRKSPFRTQAPNRRPQATGSLRKRRPLKRSPTRRSLSRRSATGRSPQGRTPRQSPASRTGTTTTLVVDPLPAQRQNLRGLPSDQQITESHDPYHPSSPGPQPASDHARRKPPRRLRQRQCSRQREGRRLSRSRRNSRQEAREG